ncbi:hypothetical protein WHR41_01436 [Cladosporium halotolerans]|uniref:Uncharacterized protein n=1 Tax=Cladosporium halotolerans TaxID=1052096 RepID=A0AB34L1P2_9PEZI
MSLVWLVTGTSTGIGRAFIPAVLARGDKVIATSRNTSSLESLQCDNPDSVRVLPLDVTSPQDEIEKAVEQAIAVWGKVDVVVNNAGYSQVGTWEDISPEMLFACFNTNVFGAHRVTRALLPHFRQRRSGWMVFVSSLSGLVGHPMTSAYAGSKFALEGMVESLAAETAPLGLHTLLVEPGRFRTEISSSDKSPVHISEVPEYAEMSRFVRDYLRDLSGKQQGDPAKLANVVLDFVRGEGVAEGKEAPLRILLGGDALQDVKGKTERLLGSINEWEHVTTSTDFES